MHKRAGTRYNARGIDDAGYVGNHVEKEQILTVNDTKTLSHVQVCGSVPIFWEQFGVKEDVNITRSPELTHKPFTTHVRDLIDSYSAVYCLNLLKLKSEREVRLTSGYCRQIYDCEADIKHLVKY